MSLFKKGLSGQWSVVRKYKNFLVFACLVLNASCGFTPMYAKHEDNTDISAKLATVGIKPIKSLIGQAYVNSLEDVLDPSHMGASKDYIIEAEISKDMQPLAIEQDRTVTRYKVIVTASYKLKEISSGQVIASGSVTGRSDYDKVDSDYATYVSENETTKRAIRELAQDTKIKIIAALSK